jgi:hypothetical protein
MATWESFIDNILSESYDIVNFTGHIVADNGTSSSGGSSGHDAVELRKLRKRWPNCQLVLQQAIKRRAQKKKPLEVVAFELIAENRPHIPLLTEHRKNTLKGVVSLLLGEGGIEDAFTVLFAVKGTTKAGKQHSLSLSDHMASLLTLIEYTYILSNGAKIQLKITSVKTVNDVLRLYYGTRCVIAHGVAAKTITEGCLRAFPTAEQLHMGMSSRPVAEEMCGLLCRLQENGRGVAVTYLELCMMYCFFSVAGEQAHGCCGDGGVGHIAEATGALEIH